MGKGHKRASRAEETHTDLERGECRVWPTDRMPQEGECHLEKARPRAREDLACREWEVCPIASVSLWQAGSWECLCPFW